MGKPTKCLGKNKGADQLRGNREADQRLCFHYMDSAIPLPHLYKISNRLPSSVTVQPGLCWTWSESKLLVFSRTSSFIPIIKITQMTLFSKLFQHNNLQSQLWVDQMLVQ